MFTGIVEGMGQIRRITPRNQSYELAIDIGELVEGARIGDSIAVDGTCLTVTRIERSEVCFDVITETIALTSFSARKVGDKVNIERSMAANGRFHGHIVAGHVDGTGRLVRRVQSPGQTALTFEIGEKLARQCITKGSISIDGVSLTLTEVTASTISVALIPHTLAITSLGFRREGDVVNIEVDQMGKWVRRILSAFVDEVPPPEGEGGAPGGLLTPDDLGKYLG